MIDLSKAKSLMKSTSISLSKALQTLPTEQKLQAPKKEVDLNFTPHYKMDIKTGFKTCYQTLSDFKKEYYPLKSATYICELKKQAKRKEIVDVEELERLEAKRCNYSGKIKKMRREILSKNSLSSAEKAEKLRQYIKENGSYLNCQECADLMADALHKKGVEVQNLCLITLNSQKNRTNYAEHVFSVVGLDSKADISNPATWGKNAIVVDAWAGICMRADEAIKYYTKFFNIDPDKHILSFIKN